MDEPPTLADFIFKLVGVHPSSYVGLLLFEADIAALVFTFGVGRSKYQKLRPLTGTVTKRP